MMVFLSGNCKDKITINKGHKIFMGKIVYQKLQSIAAGH